MASLSETGGHSKAPLLTVISHQQRPNRGTSLLKIAFAATLAASSLFYLSAPNDIRSKGKQEGEWERDYLSIPNAESALNASRRYATYPHLAGSPEGFKDAKSLLKLFQHEFGIASPPHEPIFEAGSPESRGATLGISSSSSNPSAWIDVYYPVLNTPLDRSLEVLDEKGKAVWAADLEEDGDPLDPEAAKYKNHVPAFHGLSYGGEAKGQLVYANYGTQEDYAELVAAGVKLQGKIVIVRYGAIFRGLKIKGAQELGAVGVLIYSDPRDDGSVRVENGYLPYPQGPARNPSSVQRGSVQFISIYPGDPTTPGYPAYPNATRTKGVNIPSIPSLPISWSNAERLLEEIGESPGRVSQRKIKLVNNGNTTVTPIWNTMAVIPGHITEEVVIVGNHRDAWVMGAADPTSGTVSLREIVRGYGHLLRQGWKPLRTLVFASWDAEEYGLVGSTEWGEDFADWISSNVVAYLNVDVSVVGSKWTASASPSLAHIIRQTALDVPHPTKPGLNLWHARDDEGPFTGPVDYEFAQRNKDSAALARAPNTGIPPLGSGSDFTVFLQRLGIASSDNGFGFTPTDAVYHYHSIYDSQRWEELYADPGFHRHAAVAKFLGLLALRMVDSPVLPLNTTQYALELDDYLCKVEQLDVHVTKGVNFHPLRRAIHQLQKVSFSLDKAKLRVEQYHAAMLKHWLETPPSTSCGRLSWPRLRNLVKAAYGVTTGNNNDETSQTGGGTSEYITRLKEINQKLSGFESGFISAEGIRDREWYRHLGVAPGKWLGYGATTFPALTEAITVERNVTLVRYELSRLTSLLDNMASKLQL